MTDTTTILTREQAQAMHDVVSRAGGYSVALLQDMYTALLAASPAAQPGADAAGNVYCDNCGHPQCARSTYSRLTCSRPSLARHGVAE